MMEILMTFVMAVLGLDRVHRVEIMTVVAKSSDSPLTVQTGNEIESIHTPKSLFSQNGG
jgi:hypothetical protein